MILDTTFFVDLMQGDEDAMAREGFDPYWKVGRRTRPTLGSCVRRVEYGGN